jgi:hypothetical protein
MLPVIRLLRPCAVGLGLCLGGSATQGQSVMSLEPRASSGVSLQIFPLCYQERGVRLCAPSGFCSVDTPPIGVLLDFWPGSTGTWICRAGDTATLTRAGGGTFSVASIDLAPLSASYGGGGPVTFFGTPASGPVKTVTFRTPPGLGFQTYRFTDFDDLLVVQWAQVAPYHQFDNITLDVPVATTPEPVALLLLGVGLSALLGIRCGRQCR